EADAAIELLRERFVDRGGQWQEPRDLAPARKVVDALGRLPLAIELAASRAALVRAEMSTLAAELMLPDVLKRLQDPLKPEASVRYVFEKSLLLLSPTQCVRFAALGLPAGPDWPHVVIEHLLAAVPPSPETASNDIESARADLEQLAALSLVTLTSHADMGR